MIGASRPVIGITTQTLEEIPDELPRCWIMSQRYVKTLIASGAIPWVVPLLDDPETLHPGRESLFLYTCSTHDLRHRESIDQARSARPDISET